MVSALITLIFCFITSLLGNIYCYKSHVTSENFWNEFWKMAGCASGLALSSIMLIVALVM